MGQRGFVGQGVGAVKVGEVFEAAPEPPPYLDGDAKDLWRTYAPMVVEAGLLTAADVPAFECLCRAGARTLQAARIVDCEGMTAEGYKGQPVQHPAVRIEQTSAAEFGKWCERFGLTPQGRARLSGTGKPPDAQADGIAGIGDKPTEV